MKFYYKHPIVLTVLLLSVLLVQAQTAVQTVRGIVRDKDSEMPLAGATVTLRQEGNVQGAITDGEGAFRIDQAPLGRVDLQVRFQGYEDYMASGLLVTAGKEVVLTLDVTEALGETELDAVQITEGEDNGEPLNEMASLSARSFDVEETKRYPAAISDPARMAQNFAGVSSAGDDMSNEIVIRGNSPRGMLWRLEGIEIPNPNHFGDQGSSGGPISMLSSSTLARSDFYTGAFPAEYGNAYSGVFDLRLRKGNNETRESSFMLGVLGVEASTEGYFSKNSKASYLVNYRYSTLAIMQGFFPNLDVLPAYQDLSFHINVPTSAGTFSLFGLGGQNKAENEAVQDTALWEDLGDGVSFSSRQKVGVVGLKHKLLIGEKSFVQTVLAASADNYEDLSQRIVPERDFAKEAYDITNFENYSYRIHALVNHKFDARNTLRAGVIGSHLRYEYLYDNQDWDTEVWTRFLEQKGSTEMGQAYAQWRRRIGSRWIFNAGFHATYLTLNQDFAIDPRASLSWQATERHRFSIAVGRHSKPEHPSTYFLEKTEPDGGRNTPNRDLQMTKALHIVLGHDFTFGRDFRFKAEAYYQYLTDIPVEADSNSTFAIINTGGIWSIVDAEPLVSRGTARNYGLDLTFEKFFSDGYFLLATGSLYQSEYWSLNGDLHPTRYNGNYNLTTIGGKEWKVGKDKQNILGLNAKFVGSGGNRYTPIDFAASEAAGETVLFQDRPFESRAPAYMRCDLGISYAINRRSATHSIRLDIQNLTNRANIFSQYYDSETNSLEYYYQNGIFPLLNYRVEF